MPADRQRFANGFAAGQSFVFDLKEPDGGLEGDTPSARLVAAFPRKPKRYDAMQHRVVMARFDPVTGRLSIDERFREEGATGPGFRMDNKTWPHGGNTKGIAHGAGVQSAVGRFCTDGTTPLSDTWGLIPEA